MGRNATGRRAGLSVQRLGKARPGLGGARRRVGRFGADVAGFNLHAGVRVPAHDRGRLERLCRYVLRPPLNQAQRQLLDAGRVQ